MTRNVYKYIGIALGALLASQSVWAQDDDEPYRTRPHHRRGRISGGGLGYFCFGGAFEHSDKLERIIRESFGMDYKQRSAGISLGGRGFGSPGRGIFLGGGGYAVITGTQTITTAEITTSTGAGFFNVGYGFAPGKSMLIMPFVGFGGGGLTLEVQNLSDKQLVFDKSDFEGVPAGRKRRYTYGNFMMELGLTSQFFVGENGSNGGFAIGFEAGGYILPGSSWRDANDNTVRGVSSVSVGGGYLRLTVGGGGVGRNRGRDRN